MLRHACSLKSGSDTASIRFVQTTSLIQLDQPPKLVQQSGQPVSMQATTYANIGMDFLEHFSAQASFPLAVYQGNGSLNSKDAEIRTDIHAESVVPMDTRLDVRGAWASSTVTLGARLSLWLPTGNESSFGGDKTVSGAVGIAGTYDPGPVSITLNTGYHFRPRTQLHDFRLADELTFGAGVFVPLPVLEQRLRLGAEVLGSIGIGSDTTGDVDNTPIEWRLEGRGLLGTKKQVWVSVSAGTRLSAGYAPDCRAVALVGGAYELEKSP